MRRLAGILARTRGVGRVDINRMRGDRLAIAVQAIEFFVAAVLVLLAAFGALALAYAVYGLIAGGIAHPAERFIQVLDFTLLIFVIAELFKIALAYIRHDEVIPTVMEAGLVAVARKIVVLDTHIPALDLLARCAAYGILLAAVGLTWYLLSRTNPLLARVPDSPIDHDAT
jgi:uncharacterized membrane protein (DUF373 family)